MKINCDREQLLAAFQTVAAVAPSRSPKPILQSVKLDVTDAGAALTATDLEISIQHRVEGVEVSSPGSSLLSVSKFGGILRESSDQSLKIESDGSGAKVQGERSQFRLPAEDPAEFPAVTKFEGDDYYELPARLLRELIRRTAFATDSESSRYALGGVKLEFSNDEVIAIGTDGRRLAKMAGPVKLSGQAIDPGQSVIVPTRAMTLIERALATNDSDVKIAVRGNEFVVQSERATISARLLEGRFPEWQKVFPDSSGAQRIDLAVGPTHTAVRQAAIVTSDESRGVDFTFGNGMLVLAGSAAEVGQSRVELPIGYDGDEIVIMLDPKFAMDFLKVLDSERTFTMQLKDSDSAAVCLTDDGFGYVIMPLARDR